MLVTVFFSLLLKSGGHMFVNEVGCDGFQPLRIAQTEDVTSLLLTPVSRLVPNPHLEGYFCTLLPLTCLSARCIVSESIP